MELRDSRRLTGPNFIWEKPGAVLDVLLEDAECTTSAESASVATRVSQAWSLALRRMLDALGWQAQAIACKQVGLMLPGGRLGRGMSLAMSAPLDGLYAACSINEWALEAAIASFSSNSGVRLEAEFTAALERLRDEVKAEANPALLALHAAAIEHGVAFLSDDEEVSVGMGQGSLTWPVDALPAPGEVDWSSVRDVPHVVVTGTNGKSTTVRLLFAMCRAAGELAGISSTDYVRVGERVLEEGDWSGPGGGRLLLRDKEVTIALLETARGGMMRRGLALERTDLAVVLNIGSDHLTEWGTPDLTSLADAKFIPVWVASRAVLNADDAEIIAASGRCMRPSTERIWFSLERNNEILSAHLEAGGKGAWLEAGVLWLAGFGPEAERITSVEELPMTLGGAARYNIANALAAICAARDLGLPLASIQAGLKGFESNPEDNPGRLNRIELGGVTALVDFAHNPDGMQALFSAAAAIPAKRRLALIGQAGDRDEPSTRGMARAAVEAGIDHIVIKELTEHLRGRALGELPALIEDELRRQGLDESRFSHAPDEVSSVHQAFAWAKQGDLLVLLAHDARAEVLALVQRLKQEGWQPGDPTR